MSGRHRHDCGDERGAALLVVLLIVAVMAIAAIGVTEAISFAAHRGANAAARNQALWYLHGAEELARQTIRRSFELDPDRTTLAEPWARGLLRFEVEAGKIEGELRDASNCFNINSIAVARGRGLGYEVNEERLAAFRRLLAVLDLEAPAAIAQGAADWIDADDAARGYGAEDYDYSFAAPPYRAANGLFAEVEELRAVDGVSEGAFRRVRPYLCARETTDPARLNVNTLRPEDAPLLAALFDGRLSLDDAVDVIEERPAEGWADAEGFWDLEKIAIHAVDDDVKAQVGVKASYFELQTRVHHLDAFVEGAALFRVSADGRAHLVRRRLGADA